MSPRAAAFDLRSLARRLGVSRLARVTGLDRAGVEVACAIRPGGHVLQVTNGKGLTLERAQWGAVLEAAELHAAERPVEGSWICGSERTLRAHPRVLSARALGGPSHVLGEPVEALRVAWVEGEELFSGEAALVPACAVHVPPATGPWLGPRTVPWTSNGMGAHPEPELALSHALLELIEREVLCRTLPRGWTPGALKSRAVLPPRPDGALALTCASLERQGLRPHLFRLSDDALKVDVAGALLLDLEGGPVPLTAGYAARLGEEAALLAALLEAAQSRLTDIHGAREDVSPMEEGDVAAMRAALDATKPTRRARAGGTGGGLKAVLSALARDGAEQVVAVWLGGEGLGVEVVKVFVPGFRTSELL